MPRRPNRGRATLPTSAAAVAFALLVVATVAAFAWAQRVKRDPLVIDRVKIGTNVKTKTGTKPLQSFTPNGDCRHDKIPIRFRTTITDRGTVQVVKPNGHVMLTLARDVPLRRYTFHTFWWDGSKRGGGKAPPGRYKVRVKLLGEGRTLVPAGAIHLHKPTTKQPSACKGGTGGVQPTAEGSP